MGSDKEYKGLSIDRGSRHCKIVDEEEEVVFRTTNLRDAEAYLDLVEENDRLHRLLEARGIAPHRIYLLAAEEEHRGKVNDEGHPAHEVVIVAKADNESVVVRYLEDGREAIVDLDEIEAIEGGSYLQASDITDETVHVVVRFDRGREEDATSISAWKTAEKADDIVEDWAEMDEPPGDEYTGVLYETEGELLIYRAEVSVED